MQPHGDIHNERRFFDGTPLRYPYAKEPQGATRREGRFSARMIHAVIVQGLTCGCMIARVPEKALSLGTRPYQGQLAIGRVLDVERLRHRVPRRALGAPTARRHQGTVPAAMGAVCIDAVPTAYRADLRRVLEGRAGRRQLPIAAQRGHLGFARTALFTSGWRMTLLWSSGCGKRGRSPRARRGLRS